MMEEKIYNYILYDTNIKTILIKRAKNLEFLILELFQSRNS